MLAGLFFMLVLLAYERYARRRGAGRYLLVAAVLALGLMAKPMLVTAPFVLLLLDYWPLGRLRPAGPAAGRSRPPVPWGRLLGEKAPLLALSAASSALTFLAQQQGGTVAQLKKFSLAERLANTLVSYAGYLGKTVWPSSLAVYYPYPSAAPPWWKVTGIVLLLLLASLIAVRWLIRRPYVGVGWFWFLGMLVPVIGWVQVGEQALADRYTYLPAVGLRLLLAWGMPEVLRRADLPAALGRGACRVVLGALAEVTVGAVARWKDSEALLRHTLAVTSDNWFIHYGLGVQLVEQGRSEEGAGHLEEALRLSPGYPDALFKLGLAYCSLGRFDAAVASYDAALRRQPGWIEAHENLGMLLFQIGRQTEGERHLAEARRLRQSRD